MRGKRGNKLRYQGRVLKNRREFLLSELCNYFGHRFLGRAFKSGGAEGFREIYKTSPGAFRYTAEVNEAVLGEEEHDLSELIVNLDSTIEALNQGDDLQNLVTNLRIVLGSFAAESESLERAIAILPDVLREGEPALASLNASLPALRAFSREALPGVRSTPETLDAATPLLAQIRGLVSEDELRGLTADLRPTIPRLATLTKKAIPFLDQARSLSSCFNEVVIPWSNQSVVDPENPPNETDRGPSRIFEELGYGLVGLSGESRSNDANGPYIRVGAGSGANGITIPGVNGGEDTVGTAPAPLVGAIPAIEDSAKTPFRPDVACETQEPPDLEATSIDLTDLNVGDLGDLLPLPSPSGDQLDALADAAEAADGSRGHEGQAWPEPDGGRADDGGAGAGRRGGRQPPRGAVLTMMTAIRKNLPYFLAILGLVAISGAISYYILQEQRLRIPVLEEKPFQFQAEFENAQGVVAGQGQTLRVAGVRVGDVSKVELVDGRAVVTFDVDREFLPIYENSTILMRPLTGLRDMFFSLDPGSSNTAEIEEGDTVPLANTAPDVPLDQVLEALDSDNQAYLRAILVGAGQGLDGRGKDLGRVLGSLGPINRDLERLNTKVAERDENLSSLVHNLSVLTKSVGTQDQDVMRLVTASNDALEAIATEDPDIQTAVRLLPGALEDTRDALAAAKGFGDELGRPSTRFARSPGTFRS